MLPTHTLEALVPLLIDGGKDQDNPCLKWAPAPTAATIGSGTGGFPVEDLAPAPYVATTASHVREGPGTTHPVIETLAEGPQCRSRARPRASTGIPSASPMVAWATSGTSFSSQRSRALSDGCRSDLRSL